MFYNIEKKIKVLAGVITILGIISSVVTGIILFGEKNIIMGLLTIVMGILFSWIGSFVLYGFGEIIETTKSIAKISSEIILQLRKDNTPNSKSIKENKVDNINLEINEKVEKEIKRIGADKKTCPSCGCIISIHAKECPMCGKILS